MGGVAPVVNVEGIKPGDLTLTEPPSSNLYWQHKEPERSDEVNANANFRTSAIVHRSVGSGTTFISQISSRKPARDASQPEPCEINTVFAQLRERQIEALRLIGFFGLTDKLAMLAAHHAIPAFYPLSDYVAAGGLRCASFGAMAPRHRNRRAAGALKLPSLRWESVASCGGNPVLRCLHALLRNHKLQVPGWRTASVSLLESTPVGKAVLMAAAR
jgi:hypothetical protein